MRTRHVGILLAGTMLLMLGLCACESDNDKPPVNVAGSWTATMNGGGDTETQDITLRQDGSSVTGTDAEGTPITGSVSGDTLTLSSSWTEDDGTAVKLSLSGHVTETTMNLSGTMDGVFRDGSKLSVAVTLTATKK